MTCVRYVCAAVVVAIQLGLAPGALAQAPDVRRLTVEEAVRLALENNLGIRAARIDPQIVLLPINRQRDRDGVLRLG